MRCAFKGSSDELCVHQGDRLSIKVECCTHEGLVNTSGMHIRMYVCSICVCK